MAENYLIRISTTTWIVMRESPYEPRAIIHRVIERQVPKFLLMRWDADEQYRSLIGTFNTLKSAEAAVPWDTHVAPIHMGASQEQVLENMRARGVDGSGLYGAGRSSKVP